VVLVKHIQTSGSRKVANFWVRFPTSLLGPMAKLVNALVIFHNLTIFIIMRTDIEDRKMEITEWISANYSKSYICKELKCKHETLNWWLNKLGIIYKGNQGSKGKRSPRKRTALEYIKTDSVRSCRLKELLIEEGYKDDKCDICKLTEWNDKPILLELHHMDGNRFNNNFNNLQILCCNCHAQTPSFRKKK
jgi:hypothetical protein